MIAGFSQALLDGTAGPHEVEGSSTVIHDEAIKMQHLVDDLLQLTRLESGLLTLNRHLVEIGSFIQSSIDHVQRVHAGAPKASIQYLSAPNLPRMDVDPERMERVLRNLLDNALQYTPVHGTVTVEARRAGSRWIEIMVSDTGTGIPPEDVPRIFERFYRADKGRERARGHSGLGLAIVKEIVEAHGGQVTVQSSVGEGTTFQLTVPRAAGLTTEAEEPSTRESVRQAAT
jgi:signal transduction histidine kinase